MGRLLLDGMMRVRLYNSGTRLVMARLRGINLTVRRLVLVID